MAMTRIDLLVEKLIEKLTPRIREFISENIIGSGKEKIYAIGILDKEENEVRSYGKIFGPTPDIYFCLAFEPEEEHLKEDKPIHILDITLDEEGNSRRDILHVWNNESKDWEEYKDHRK